MFRKLLTVLAATALGLTLLAVIAPAAQATAPAGQASTFFQMTNDSRASYGRAPLAWDQNLANSAQAYANELAARDVLAHAAPEQLAAQVAAAVPSPTTWGENIAWVSPASVSRIQTSYMSSEGHRANVISADYDRVGVGFANGPNGKLYNVTRFAYSSNKSALGQPIGSFDSATSPAVNKLQVSGWAIDPDSTGGVAIDIKVNGVLKRSITAQSTRTDVGSGYPGYGSNHGFSLTLDETGGPPKSVCAEARNITGYGTTQSLGCKTVTIIPDTSGPFYDVPGGSTFASDIQWLVDESITPGLPGVVTFQPTGAMTRGTMASFLWNYAGQPAVPSGAPTFSDVPTSNPFRNAIRWMASEGITVGYGDGTFRPNDAVSRGSIAAFLWRYSDEPVPSPSAPTFSDVPSSSPFFVAVKWMAGNEITVGYPGNLYKPNESVARQGAAAFLHRMDTLPR